MRPIRVECAAAEPGKVADNLRFYIDDESVVCEPEITETAVGVWLTPSKARRLSEWLAGAADQIDGGEVEEDGDEVI